MNMIDKLHDFLEISNLSGNRLYLWGAGRIGNLLYRYISKKNLKVYGILDNNKEIAHSKDERVFAPEEFDFNNNQYFIISVLNDKANYEIHEKLLSNNISETNILHINHSQFLEYIYKNSELVSNPFATNLLKFKNIYSGKRCFILGNGPSLILKDLDKLTKEITFASNNIINSFDKTNYRPTFYFCSDIIDVAQKVDTIKNGDPLSLQRKICECENVFSLYERASLFKELKNIDINYYQSESGYYVYPEISKELKIYGNEKVYNKLSKKIELFSEKCERYVVSTGGVSLHMLQFAVYMGIKEIYLLGMDNSYSLDDPKQKDYATILDDCRYIEDGEYKVKENYFAPTVGVTEFGFFCAKKYADEHGIKIYNATRGGKLEIFSRVDFDTLF